MATKLNTRLVTNNSMDRSKFVSTDRVFAHQRAWSFSTAESEGAAGALERAFEELRQHAFTGLAFEVIEKNIGHGCVRGV